MGLSVSWELLRPAAGNNRELLSVALCSVPFPANNKNVEHFKKLTKIGKMKLIS